MQVSLAERDDAKEHPDVGILDGVNSLAMDSDSLAAAPEEESEFPEADAVVGTAGQDSFHASKYASPLRCVGIALFLDDTVETRYKDFVGKQQKYR